MTVSSRNKTIIVVALVFFIVAMIIGGPLAFIWSLNSLFGLGIEMTLKTWAAALFLMACVNGRSSCKSKGGA